MPRLVPANKCVALHVINKMVKSKQPHLCAKDAARYPSLRPVRRVARAGYSFIWTATCSARDLRTGEEQQKKDEEMEKQGQTQTEADVRREKKEEDEIGEKRLCVLKVSRKPRKKDRNPERYARAVERELSAYRLLPRNAVPYFVQLHASVTLHDGTRALLLECYAHSTPLSRVVSKGNVTEYVRAIFRTLLRAVEACHRCGVAHHDLKPDNILLRHAKSSHVVLTDSGEVDLRLLDFGLAQPLSEEECCGPCGGTPAYVAPEVLWQHPHASAFVDAWSLGALLYELCTGYPLLCGHSLSDFRYQAMQLNPREAAIRPCDASALDLVCAFMHSEPQQRIGISAALQSKFLSVE